MPETSGGFVTPTRLPRWQEPAVGLVVIGVLWGTMHTVGLDPKTLVKGAIELTGVAKAFATMPEWAAWSVIARGLEETVEMAVVGTVMAIPVSIFLSLLCARNTTFHPVFGQILKGVLAVGRGIPFFCYAMVIVSAAGLGVLSGVLALAISSTLYTAKVFSESLEVVSAGPVEAIQSVGAGWSEIRRYGILPQAATGILGQSLYTFEGNIRLSTALGIVGAGGIGFEFSMALRNLNYGRALLILLCIYLLVTGIDRASQWIRARLI